MTQQTNVAEFETRLQRIVGIVLRDEKILGHDDPKCIRGRAAIADGRRMLDRLREEVATRPADRASVIVETVIRSSLRPGSPLPYRRIIAAKVVKGRGKARDGAEAELEMFDGETARFECENWGRDPDAYRHSWSRVEGGAFAFVEGKWRRVEEVDESEEAEPERSGKTLEACRDRADKFRERELGVTQGRIIPIFASNLELSSFNLRAAIISIVANEDGSYAVKHGCYCGSSCYGGPHSGNLPTIRAAFDEGASSIRRHADQILEADATKRSRFCYGAQENRVAKRVIAWLDALVPPAEVAPVILDLGIANARIEARPQPDGRWLAIAGYSYSGLSGHPALDSGIGTYDTADEAVAAGVARVRDGAEVVLAPGFGNDIPAAQAKAARRVLAWCDERATA